jgi:hypothetical protein
MDGKSNLVISHSLCQYHLSRSGPWLKAVREVADSDGRDSPQMLSCDKLVLSETAMTRTVASPGSEGCTAGKWALGHWFMRHLDMPSDRELQLRQLNTENNLASREK